jgi:hypothetical protein
MRMTKASERVLSGFVVENATSDDDMVAIVIRGSAASRRFSRAGKSGSALTADRGGPRPTFPRPARRIFAERFDGASRPGRGVRRVSTMSSTPRDRAWLQTCGASLRGA